MDGDKDSVASYRSSFQASQDFFATFGLQVAELAALFRSRQVTSVELVEIFTARMRRCAGVLCSV